MQTCRVVLPLVPVAVGEAFELRAWPPHIALVGDIRMPDGATDSVAAVLRCCASGIAPVTAAVVGDGAWSGADGSVLGDPVDPLALLRARGRLLDALESAVEGLEAVLPAQLRDGCRPATAGSRPSPGGRIEATELVLVELDPADRPGTGVVLARFALGQRERQEAETGADAVHRVLDALVAAGAAAWVIGGWGVDALAGVRTRAHHDLDLFVDAEATEAAVEALAALGYVVRYAWSENRWQERDRRLLPSAFVAIDDEGREVDVHTVTVEEGRVLPRSHATVVLPPGALDAIGTVAGRAVPCASAEAQGVMHTGYPLPARQRGDVEVLRRLTR